MAFNTFAQHRVSVRKGPSCTHHTMTRLYTKDFRCLSCCQVSSNGWVYRCTQDRELILGNAFDLRSSDKFDALVDIFPMPDKPAKRSPEARACVNSFLEENTQEQLESYTDEQLQKIYNQRTHVLKIAAEQAAGQNGVDANDSSSSTDSSTHKPWHIADGDECQFKCCQNCRPTLSERAYLSMDGIVKGDIPRTAATGFGFHLQSERRPVASAEVVKNVGLRPTPIPRIYSPSVETSNENKHSPRRLPPPPGLGLGLITNSSVPLLSRPLPELPTSKPTEDTQVHDFAYGPRATLLKRSSRASVDITSYYSGNPDTTPSISESGEELDTVSVPLTPMEKNEMQGYFGAGPLEVVDGIAVTEEAVGLHVPDLITQF